MPRLAGQGRLPQDPGGQEIDDASRRLLRDSHIFASAVRDILELQALRQVSRNALTLTQLQLLKLMMRDGRREMHRVAEYLGVSAPAATKNIDKLESLGLVVRTPSEGDRRVTWLSVSPRGRRLVRNYERRRAALFSPVVADFGSEEVRRLSALLERFSVSLIQREHARHEFCLRCAADLERGCAVSAARGGCPFRVEESER